MIVTMAHLRTVPGHSARPGYCARGGRAWFQRHGLDWVDFLRHGIDADILRATGDGLALSRVEHAERTEAARG